MHIVSGLMISTFAALFLGGLVLVIGGWETTDTLPLWATAVMQIPLWAGLLGVPWWVVRRRKLSWKNDLGWQFQKKDVLSGLGIGVFAQAVFVPLVYLPVMLIKDDLDISGPARELINRAQGFDIILLVLVVVVGAPIIEEIFFRGVTLRSFENRFSPRAALLASALVFGLIHWQPLQFPALFMFGLVAGKLTQKDGRLGRAIWAHVGFNAWTVGMLVLL